MQPLDQTYWDNRHKQGLTGWDMGYASPPLMEYCQNIKNKSIRILIPGAGNAYELDYLLKAGFSNTSVIDISPTAIARIKQRHGDLSDEHLYCEDFFDHTGKYDLILEQTFFCALDPGLRQNYIDKVYDLLLPEGKIAGVLFDFPLTSEGPPFGGSAKEYRSLFKHKFQINILERCRNSIPPRAGNELFFEAEKKNKS